LFVRNVYVGRFADGRTSFAGEKKSQAPLGNPKSGNPSGRIPTLPPSLFAGKISLGMFTAVKRGWDLAIRNRQTTTKCGLCRPFIIFVVVWLLFVTRALSLALKALMYRY
jgi:hypothetical protein